MAEFTVNASRFDPYRSFLFQVVLEGAVVAGVSKVGALKRSTEVVSHRPGNAISHQFHSPGLSSHEPIMLERGVTYDAVFNTWANEVYSPEGLGGVFTAMGLTYIAFEGYEIIVQSGEEVVDPGTNVPKAVFYSLALVVPIYVLVAFVTTTVLSP